MHFNRLMIFIFLLVSNLLFAQESLPLVKELLNEAYRNEFVDYQGLTETYNPEEIRSEISKFDYSSSTIEEKTAFLINVYNALVITSIIEAYPVASVEQIPHFFSKVHNIDGKQLSLDQIEDLVYEISNTADFHFALNCGAKSCPRTSLILPSELKERIESLATENLQKSHILKIDDNSKSLQLNKIFFWNKADFDKESGSVKDYLEKHLKRSFRDYRINFQEYDWSLNDSVNESGEELKRFYPVKIYGKGELEVKLFNNYYTQSEIGANDLRFRTSYHSSFLQVLFGSSKNYNLGFDLKFRSVERLDNNNPLFHALRFRDIRKNESEAFARAGLSHAGFRIKYQPFKDKANIHFLHSIYFSTMGDSEGNESYDWVDFDGIQIYNQMYLEHMTGPRSILFLDAGLFIEGLKFDLFKEEGAFTQMLLPVNLLWSYYPIRKMTIYGLIGLGPRFGIDNRSGSLGINFDAFAQLGPGFKYFVTELIELEILYTQFLTTIEGQRAASFNFGIRYKY